MCTHIHTHTYIRGIYFEGQICWWTRYEQRNELVVSKLPWGITMFRLVNPPYHFPPKVSNPLVILLLLNWLHISYWKEESILDLNDFMHTAMLPSLRNSAALHLGEVHILAASLSPRSLLDIEFQTLLQASWSWICILTRPHVLCKHIKIWEALFCSPLSCQGWCASPRLSRCSCLQVGFGQLAPSGWFIIEEDNLLQTDPI